MICLLPLEPCSLRVFKCETLAVINVIMIEADMYGIMPKANMPISHSATPENVSKTPNMPDDCCSKNC